jgi:hypothetical protein
MVMLSGIFYLYTRFFVSNIVKQTVLHRDKYCT